MQGDLSKILEERDAELATLRQKEQELVNLQNQYGKLQSELASVAATKEAQRQDKKSMKHDLKARISELEE